MALKATRTTGPLAPPSLNYRVADVLANFAFDAGSNFAGRPT